MKSKTALIIHIDDELLAKLKMYSELHAMPIEDMIDHVLADFMSQPALDDVAQSGLAHGYQTMAKLNTQICHEFAACECEVDQLYHSLN
ncbi:MAG: hypothetical protein H9901_05605 [Candidatus Paralactobacillus gallistercoris]|uniref:Uncharacterized protein n=1 Tax=Candidatus Paralactobacillus gallistercoris TaxID=2838724 RepID=A0A948TKD8_9LACO|nr:hypothetical protein [Candidatus Paralactobacillus gallistercoris]